VEQQMPEVQEAIKEAFYETISRWGSKFSMTALKNILIATGNEALWNAILDGSMTPQQALLLKKVIKDPQVAEAVGEVKETAMEGINDSIESIQQLVLPKVNEAAGKFATGIGTSVITAASDIPPVGAVISAVSAVGTLVDAAENATEITEGFKTAIEPITTAVGEIDKINDAVTDAVARAESEMPQAQVGAQVGAQAGTQAGEQVGAQADAQVGTQAGEQVGEQVGAQAGEQVGAQADAQSDKKVSTALVQPEQLEKKSAPVSTTAAAAGGGSRKRRHIHKLSRRIERTLRRVQKKYGLHDKNSFLRRTLHSRKK
jgi:hypothetical protein